MEQKVFDKRKAIIVCIGIFVIIVLLLFVVIYKTTRCDIDDCKKTKEKGTEYCYYHNAIYDVYINELLSNNASNDVLASAINNLFIYDLSIETNSAATYCVGKVGNIGSESYKFVKLKGVFKNANGNVIDTGSSYAVGDEGLAPGENVSFRISCSPNSSIRMCDVTVYDVD